MNDSTNAPKAVSLFSGAGGIDIGLSRIGVETLVCVENDKHAAQTLKANSSHHEEFRPPPGISYRGYPWKVMERDIRTVSGEEILQVAGVNRDSIDLVVGGPPCQTFSRSNEGERQGTASKRGMLFWEFARIVQELEPAMFVFENVRGLVSSNNGDDLQRVEKTLSGESIDEPLGDAETTTAYNVNSQVVNTANFGIPQTRQRLIITGSKLNKPNQITSKIDEANWISARDALNPFDIDESVEETSGYLDAVGGQYGHLLNDIPPGANYQHFSERHYDPTDGEYVQRDVSDQSKKIFDWRSRHWNYLLKQDPGRPSWTIQARPGTYVGPFHWRSRPLSLLERMRLQDFPIDYYLSGDYQAIQQQIGNAVPPGLAEAVVAQLLGIGDHSSEQYRSQQRVTMADGGEENQNNQISVEVGANESPWQGASEVINTLLSGKNVAVSASGKRIPNALDIADIARRSINHDVDVSFERGSSQKGHDEGVTPSQISVSLSLK